MHRARGMIGREVKRFEVVPVVFYFGPIDALVSESGEDLADPLHCPGHRMKILATRAATGHGHIYTLIGQTCFNCGFIQHGLAR